VHFAQAAQEATLLDYLNEVDHAAARIARLEKSIDVALEHAPQKMRAVVRALQALRGVAKISAVSIVAEVGELCRFERARQLMGYTGLGASEHSSGERVRRYGITKTGNAHLRRIVIEAAWAYRHRPWRGELLKQRQQGLSAPILETAWKAQHRLHDRYRKLLARGKTKQQVIVAVARELMGFIWAIGVQAEPATAVAAAPCLVR
jgi:transposase